MSETRNATGESQPGATAADDLRAAMTASAEPVSPPPAPSADTPEPAAATPEAAGPKIDATGRAHAQDGKFAPKPGEPPAAPEAPAAAVATPIQPDPAAATPAPVKLEPIEAPAHWDKATKEAFAKLPPEGQRIYVDREMHLNKVHTQRSQELADRFRPLAEIETLIAPRVQGLAMRGMTPAQEYGQLTALADFADQKPEAFLVQFAQARGIDLGHLVGAAQQQGPSDPYVQRLEQQLAQQAQQLQQITGQFQQRQQSEQLTAQQQIDAEIASVRDARDETGALKYPHFEALRAEMSALIQVGRAQDIPTAYELAVWANPETREARLAADRRQAEAKRETEERAKADQARRAGSSINGTPSGSLPAPVFADVRDELRHHMTSGQGRL